MALAVMSSSSLDRNRKVFGFASRSSSFSGFRLFPNCVFLCVVVSKHQPFCSCSEFGSAGRRGEGISAHEESRQKVPIVEFPITHEV
jgi:hypothetical protein